MPASPSLQSRTAQAEKYPAMMSRLMRAKSGELPLRRTLDSGKHRSQIFIRSFDCHEIELLVEKFERPRREKCR